MGSAPIRRYKTKMPICTTDTLIKPRSWTLPAEQTNDARGRWELSLNMPYDKGVALGKATLAPMSATMFCQRPPVWIEEIMACAVAGMRAFDKDLKIVDISRAVGIRDQRYFARQFRKRFGMSTTNARQEFQRYRKLDPTKLAKPSEIGEYKRSLLPKSVPRTR